MAEGTGTTLQNCISDEDSAQLRSQADKKAKALEMKDRGNQLYKEKKFLDAALSYTQGIELDPSIPTLHSNRSAVYIEMAKRTKEEELKKEILDRALRDSAKSIAIDSKWEKGYLRLGGTLEALGKHEEAAAALVQGLKLNPESKDIKEKLSSLRADPSITDNHPEVQIEPILEHWKSKTEDEEKAWIERQMEQQKQHSHKQATATSSSSSADDGPLAHLGFKEKPGAKEHPGRKFIQSEPPPLIPRPRYQEEYVDDDELEYTVIDHSARQREKEKQKLVEEASKKEEPEDHAKQDENRGRTLAKDTSDSNKNGVKEHPAEETSPKPGLFRRIFSSIFGSRKPAVPDPEQQVENSNSKEITEPSPNPKFYKWATAIGEDKMYEWFLDCYRFQESGGPDTVNADFHSPMCTRLAFLPFLLFCKLAVRRGVLPPNWDWRKFLSVCKEELWRKLSHDEALARYGRMVMLQCAGDESPNMITTAEHVYACEAGTKMPEDTKQQQRETSKAFYEWLNANSGEVFSDVGGRGVWEWLAKKEPPPGCNCKKSKWAKQFDVSKEEESEKGEKKLEGKEEWAKGGDGNGSSLK